MAISFKNLSTNEVLAVSNIRLIGGREYFFTVRDKGCGTKFFNRNVCFAYNGDACHGGKNGTSLLLKEGWEPVETPKAPRAPRAKKSPKVATTEPTTEPQEPVYEPEPEPTVYEPQEPVYEPEPEPTVYEPEPQPTAGEEPEPTATVTAATVATAVALASGNVEAIVKRLTKKYGALAGDILEAAAEIINAKVDPTEVERMVDLRMDAWAKNGRSMGATITVVTPRGNFTVSGNTCKHFNRYCSIVESGKPLYMYGPAGSGKSYTARQIAEALGLDYYETSQALFAHELKGYGDANGKFVETAFYRAFVGGGIFFLDEVDASAPEALVVLNNAIANGRFDFPVIGNVNAHENFRVIAAGNTRMTGATLEYTARQMQDTSFKNRFFFTAVTYDQKIMLEMAGGDVSIVEFGADLRKAARTTGITQLFSYRQAKDLATLQEACEMDDAWLLRGSVLQEKEVDECLNLYERLTDKSNRWAKAMKACIEEMKTEEIW